MLTAMAASPARDRPARPRCCPGLPVSLLRQSSPPTSSGMTRLGSPGLTRKAYHSEIDIIQGIQRAFGSPPCRPDRQGRFRLARWPEAAAPPIGWFPLGLLQCTGNLRPHQRLGARHRRAHLGFVLLAHGVNHGGSTDNRTAVRSIMTARICPVWTYFAKDHQASHAPSYLSFAPWNAKQVPCQRAASIEFLPTCGSGDTVS